MIQRTDEWYMARKGCVGGSSISDVMAKGAGKTRHALMMRIVAERLASKPIETYKSAAMERGIELEAQAITEYELANNCFVERVGWISHPSIEFCGCSPDGLVGNAGLIEIKCPLITTATEYFIDKKIPRDYMLQMQWQMAVTDRKWCDYVVYCPDFADSKMWLNVVKVERDEKSISEITEEVKKFLGEVEKIIAESFA